MKIFGGLLIIVSSVIASYFYENKQKKQIKDLKELYNFIEHIKIQIEYFSSPLKEIYDKYISDNQIIRDIKCGISPILSNKTAETEFSSCFNTLGKGYKKEQLKNLEYISNILSKEIQNEESNLHQKIKIFRALSLFVGCCTVILLV